MSELLPTNRCCESHTSWTDLVQHLVDGFPGVRAGEVIEIIGRCRAAVETFGLPEDERLETAELMARYQLMQLTGEITSVVRLDPEDHSRRSRSAIPQQRG